MTPVPGIGEVRAGDDVGELLAHALDAAALSLTSDDVVVVASKIVAKAQGRAFPAAERHDVVAQNTAHVVARRAVSPDLTTHVVRTVTGPVLAAAGVDSSNTEPGTCLALPVDPDASARDIRGVLRRRTGANAGVLITDSASWPWRVGVTDFALGVAGLAALEDAVGLPDRSGRPLGVTVRGIADAIAAAADLARDKASGHPALVVSGCGDHVTADDGPGAACLVRPAEDDWFRYGHVDAIDAALAADTDRDPESVAAAPLSLAELPLAARVARAVSVSELGADAPWDPPTVSVDAGRVEATGDAVSVGAFMARLQVAAWAMDLTGGCPRIIRDGVEDASAVASFAVR